jgi:FkbM family methyltransferase
LRNRRALTRKLLGRRLAQELHARRWARTLPGFLDPDRRPFEMALIYRFTGPGDTVLDFGAHGGAWTYPLSKRVGPGGCVHAFEIFPYYADALERALALQHVENVRVHPYGAGETDGEVAIVLADEAGDELTGLIHTAATHEHAQRTQLVPVRTFDSLTQTSPALLDASFAKIDVEGSEFALFRGARLLLERARPIIFCEVTKRQCARNGHTRADVLDYVAAAGYRVNIYLESGQIEPIQPSDPDLPGDFLFVPNERRI